MQGAGFLAAVDRRRFGETRRALQVDVDPTVMGRGWVELEALLDGEDRAAGVEDELPLVPRAAQYPAGAVEQQRFAGGGDRRESFDAPLCEQ